MKELVFDNHPILNECINIYKNNLDNDLLCQNLLYILFDSNNKI
jgi:hypothetical protein